MSKAKKLESASDHIISAQHVVRSAFEAITDHTSKPEKAQNYLVSLPMASKNVVAAEDQLYVLCFPVKYWANVCRQKKKNQHIRVAALV